MLDDLPFADEESETEQELAPSVDIPDASAASTELQRKFWTLVLVFNAAILSLSIGAMLVGFQGDWDAGGSLLAAGIVLSVYGGFRYRTYTRKD
ncbi:DUF7322 domain-containing protein [Halobacterium rubrum]|uniref:DUF7322 domain-containing protein n=1 Tax=Halobacterium TaxID=2239 RepID=UPI001F443EF5|nr:hypothetical protein [Halobacterium rubrum]MDH5020683.1 hypothetical protein [Halobacterium rubrum]